MATDKRVVTELNLEGSEIGTATVMQMADALQAKTVEIAEMARQLRANAHEVALHMADARGHVLPKGRLVRTEKPNRLELSLLRGELDISVVEGAESLLSAFQGLEQGTLDGLVQWIQAGQHSTRRGIAPLAELLPDTVRRSISVNGFAFSPKHGNDPKTDGEAARMRIKYDPGAPPVWLNLAIVVLLARIGAQSIMAITTSGEYRDGEHFEDDGGYRDERE